MSLDWRICEHAVFVYGAGSSQGFLFGVVGLIPFCFVSLISDFPCPGELSVSKGFFLL